MKKLFLGLLMASLSVPVFAQDPDVFGTWDLFRIEVKFSQGLQISEVEPPISPWLTINEDLEFEGFGACNSFSGTFEYIPNDRLRPINYEETLLDCDTQLHDDIEDEYFGYFKFESVLGFWISIGSDGLQHLFVSTGSPGFRLEFVRSALFMEDHPLATFTLHPNPTKGSLFIVSEMGSINTIALYTVTGQLLVEKAGDSPQVDVSDLSPGIYFAQITSEEGRAVKKFIKE